jgi:hypothetical protein
MGSSTVNDEYALFEVVDTEDCDQKYGSKSTESPGQAAKANETKALTMNMLWGLLIAFGVGLIYWVFSMYNGTGVANAASDTGIAVANADPSAPQ